MNKKRFEVFEIIFLLLILAVAIGSVLANILAAMHLPALISNPFWSSFVCVVLWITAVFSACVTFLLINWVLNRLGEDDSDQEDNHNE